MEGNLQKSDLCVCVCVCVCVSFCSIVNLAIKTSQLVFLYVNFGKLKIWVWSETVVVIGIWVTLFG